MTAPIRLFGLGLALLLTQQLLAAILPDAFRPDLLLVFALALGLRARATESLLLAFAFGYGVDVLSGAPVGLYALLRGTACLITHFANRGFYLRAAGPWVTYVAGYVVLDTLLMGGILRLAQPDMLLPASELALRLPGTVLLTAAVAMPIYRLFRRLDPEDEPSGLISGPMAGPRIP